MRTYGLQPGGAEALLSSGDGKIEPPNLVVEHQITEENLN